MVKNIVIIGGGFAGVAVASGLEKQLDKSGDKDHRIILIEKVIWWWSIKCKYLQLTMAG